MGFLTAALLHRSPGASCPAHHSGLQFSLLFVILQSSLLFICVTSLSGVGLTDNEGLWFPRSAGGNGQSDTYHSTRLLHASLHFSCFDNIENVFPLQMSTVT